MALMLGKGTWAGVQGSAQGGSLACSKWDVRVGHGVKLLLMGSLLKVITGHGLRNTGQPKVVGAYSEHEVFGRGDKKKIRGYQTQSGREPIMV